MLMKKIFTLIAMAVMTIGVNAQTLINYPTSKTGVTVSGTTVEGTVKIHTNVDAVACLALKNGFLTEDKMNGNHILLEVEGGFKAGDVVTIAGAINNSDETKRGTANLFVSADGETATSLNIFTDFINGRLVADDPVEETFTLTADADKLYIGRDGNTGTNLTLIKVVRPGGEDPEPEPEPEPQPTSGIDYPTSENGITLSGTTVKGTVKIHENADAVACISLKNGYTTDNVMNGNHILLEIEGGFKTGDVVTVGGAINNSDETKRGTADLFVSEDGVSATSLKVFDDFINGRLVADDIVPQTYTLEADAAKLYIGRNGNTGTNLTIIKVTRGGSDNILNVRTSIVENGVVYNLAGQKVNAGFKGIAIKNGKKVVLK